MKTKRRAVLPLLLALSVLLSLPAPASAARTDPVSARDTGFDDVPSDAWYAEAAAWCRQRGLMNGTAEGTFSPNRTMTRGMAAAVLYRLAGSPVVAADSGFGDVPEWCAAAVAWAAKTGVTAGYSPDRFGPGDPVTRQQMAVFLWRYAGSPPPETSGTASDSDGTASGSNGTGSDTASDTDSSASGSVGTASGSDGTASGSGSAVPAFTDQDQIGGYALDAVRWARSAGAVNGYADGSFRPRSSITRAQMAKILTNYASQSAPPTAQSALTDADALSGLPPLWAPCGIAAAADGALLITDTWSKAVWRIENGVSTRYAGAETPEDLYGQPVGGFREGTLSECLFRLPWAIAPFRDGWAVSDAENNVIRLLQPRGSQTLFPAHSSAAGGGSTAAGSGTTAGGGTAAGSGTTAGGGTTAGSGTTAGGNTSAINRTAWTALEYPTGLASDEAGNLYVSDTRTGTIWMITPSGGRSALVTGLEDPMGLCWTGGTLYAAETGANRIVRVADGQAEVVAGNGEADWADGPAAQAAFACPQGIAAADDGTLYVSDTANGAVRRIRDGVVETVVRYDPAEPETGPLSPVGLLVQDGTLYVCDQFSRKVYRLDVG